MPPASSGLLRVLVRAVVVAVAVATTMSGRSGRSEAGGWREDSG